MNREELYMVETYKCEELKKRLNPILDWSKVKEGQLMFHNQDNNIFNESRFSEYNKTDNLVWYKTRDGLLYNMSATGWYYYDESVADEVEEYFTPKLYIVSSVKYPEDYSFVVSFNEKYLKNDFLKSMKFDDVSDSEFEKKFQYEVLKSVDGFEVVLK